MPYDPRMLQMARQGIGMMGPQPSPFERSAPPRAPQWWEQPMPQGQASQMGQTADPSNPDDPNAPKKKPPSLLDMMMGLGRMTRPQYDKAIQSSPPGQQQGMAMVSPWAWLGSMGSGGPR